MPVILVSVVREVAENKIRFYLSNYGFNFTDQITIHNHVGVFIAAPVYFFGT